MTWPSRVMTNGSPSWNWSAYSAPWCSRISAICSRETICKSSIFMNRNENVHLYVQSWIVRLTTLFGKIKNMFRLQTKPVFKAFTHSSYFSNICVHTILMPISWSAKDISIGKSSYAWSTDLISSLECSSIISHVLIQLQQYLIWSTEEFNSVSK